MKKFLVVSLFLFLIFSLGLLINPSKIFAQAWCDPIQVKCIDLGGLEGFECQDQSGNPIPGCVPNLSCSFGICVCNYCEPAMTCRCSGGVPVPGLDYCGDLAPVCYPDDSCICRGPSPTPTPTLIPLPTATPTPTGSPPNCNYYTFHCLKSNMSCLYGYGCPAGCVPEFDCTVFHYQDCNAQSGNCIAIGEPTSTPAATPPPGESCNEVDEPCCCSTVPIGGCYQCHCSSPLVPSDSCPLEYGDCVCLEAVGPTSTPIPCGGGPADAILCCPTPTPPCRPGYQTLYEEGLCTCFPGIYEAEPFCDTSLGEDTGINTALGCIPFTTRAFTPWLIGRAIAVAGGIGFLLILYAGFQYITSSGDPQKVQAAKQLLTAAISGLLLIIFSIFLLRLIGITILDIPGL